MLDISFIIKYNSLMIKNNKLAEWPTRTRLKPEYKNMLHLFRCEIHFTRSEISGRFVPYYFNKISALECDRCVNRGEPAAVLGFHGNIKVGEFKVPEFAAVGSLGVVIGHWEGLKVRSLVIGRILKNGHWSLVIGHWEGTCAVVIGLLLFIIIVEPAAVFKAHETTAAGSLFGWSLGGF